MAAVFDNLEDVQSKFNGTICYFNKKAVMVKAANIVIDKPNEYILTIAGQNGRSSNILLSDPGFSYKDFNLGYANANNYSMWWFRKPSRQYRQGLRRDQLGWLASDHSKVVEDNFNMAKPYTLMLENIYPSMEECQRRLLEEDTNLIAFHRDFAIAWDNMHNDFILEYRGKKVGLSVNSNLDKFQLKPEFNHLAEALTEVCRNVG